MLIQPRPDRRHKRQPVLAKLDDFGLFLGMTIRNALQQFKFVVHEAHVMHRQFAGLDHRLIPVKGLAAQDNALICFFGGHEANVADWRVGW